MHTAPQVLLVLLCPLCLVAYAWARFGSQWKLYLRYRLSHSNPKLSILYLHKDARDDLRTQLFEPAASRKENVPVAQSSARTAPEEDVPVAQSSARTAPEEETKL